MVEEDHDEENGEEMGNGAEQAAGSQDCGLVYDPDQDQEERRTIRRNYRKLQDDEDLQNPNAIGIDDLASKVEMADRLFEKVKAPQEATLDSAFLVTATTISAAKARQMRADIGGFDIDDFVARLVTYMGGHVPGEQHIDDEDDIDARDRPLNWDLIGRKALAKSRRVPVMDFMMGPLYVEPKQRVTKVRAKHDRNKEEERRPQELKEADVQKSENETTGNVIQVEKTLERLSGPINIFRLIVNPQSFGQSVENLFYLSFLIRDGKVALQVNEETGEPEVYLCEPPGDEDYAEGVKKKQMVMELDVATWKKAIEAFHITEPVMPTRQKSKTRLGDKWYG